MFRTVVLPKAFTHISLSSAEFNNYRKVKSEIKSQEQRKQTPSVMPLGQEETCQSFTARY